MEPAAALGEVAGGPPGLLRAYLEYAGALSALEEYARPPPEPRRVLEKFFAAGDRAAEVADEARGVEEALRPALDAAAARPGAAAARRALRGGLRSLAALRKALEDDFFERSEALRRALGGGGRRAGEWPELPSLRADSSGRAVAARDPGGGEAARLAPGLPLPLPEGAAPLGRGPDPALDRLCAAVQGSATEILRACPPG